jgi:type I restriction enzyme S subunit
MTWEKVKLGELYTIYNGLAKGREFFGQGYPFVSFSLVFNNYFIPKAISSLVESTEVERTKYSIKRGDILITRTSETPDELGMTSVALDDIPNATYNGFSKRLRPITDRVVPEFIGYYLRSFEFRRHFMGITGSMTTRASLRNEFLLDIEIPVPTIEEQNRIARVLRTYDELIENSRKQIALLEEAAQRLYREWFVDFRFPGSTSHNSLPQGWTEESVDSLLAKVHRTKQIPTSEMIDNGSIPVIDQSRDFIAGYTDDVDSLVKSDVPIIVFGDHTRVLKYIQFPFAKGADGTQLILSNDFKRMPQSLFYVSLVNVDLSNYSYARHFKYLKQEKIVVPTEQMAHQFDLIASNIFAKIQSNREMTNKLIQARDALLPKLMSGELKV